MTKQIELDAVKSKRRSSQKYQRVIVIVVTIQGHQEKVMKNIVIVDINMITIVLDVEAGIITRESIDMQEKLNAMNVAVKITLLNIVEQQEYTI